MPRLRPQPFEKQHDFLPGYLRARCLDPRQYPEVQNNGKAT